MGITGIQVAWLLVKCVQMDFTAMCELQYKNLSIWISYCPSLEVLPHVSKNFRAFIYFCLRILKEKFPSF